MITFLLYLGKHKLTAFDVTVTMFQYLFSSPQFPRMTTLFLNLILEHHD